MRSQRPTPKTGLSTQRQQARRRRNLRRIFLLPRLLCLLRRTDPRSEPQELGVRARFIGQAATETGAGGACSLLIRKNSHYCLLLYWTFTGYAYLAIHFSSTLIFLQFSLASILCPSLFQRFQASWREARLVFYLPWSKFSPSWLYFFLFFVFLTLLRTALFGQPVD